MDTKEFRFMSFTLADLLGLMALIVAIITVYFLDLKDIMSLFIFSLLILLGYALTGWLNKNKKNKIKLPEIYNEIVDENEKIKRQNIRVSLEKFINSVGVESSDLGKILILTGRSGVGKSHIAKEDLTSIAKTEGYNIDKDAASNRTFQIINEYLKETLLKNLRAVSAVQPKDELSKDLDEIIKLIKEKTIIIFDQFEDLFKLPLTETEKNSEGANHGNSSREESIELFRKLFNAIINKTNIKIIIIIREEFIYNLFVFKECLPWCEFIPIYGLEEFNSDKIGLDPSKYPTPVKNLILDQLKTDDNVVLQIDEERNIKRESTILPIEAMIVVKMLKTRFPREESISKDDIGDLGGVRGIILDYLKRFVDTSSNPVNCAKVLFALSVSPHENRQLDKTDISDITQLCQDDVSDIIHELLNKKIIKLINSREILYDWSHDFLAEKFHEVSASILAPDDRDNISFFWHQKRRGIDSSHFKTKRDDSQKGKIVFGYSVLIASLLLLLLKLFKQPISSPEWLQNLKIFGLQIFTFENWPVSPFTYDLGWKLVERFDLPFLFVAISLSIWAIYICWIHNRLLASIVETDKLGRIFSAILPISSLICVLGTCYYPTYWISFTGVGGFFVGLKFLQLARLRGKKIWLFFRKQEGWFKDAGWQTVFNSIVMILFGYYYSKFFGAQSLLKDATVSHVAWISFFIWFVMIVFGIGISINGHVSKNKIPTRIGEYVRNQYRV